jgi:hypothetical protein
VHGNSLNSTATNWLYRITDTKTGDLVKWGISQNPARRYSRAELRGKTMELMTSGSRREMINLERWIVERNPGPQNFERWAGTKADDVPGGP